MRNRSSFAHHTRWLYSEINGRTYTFGIFWRLISIFLILAVIYLAFGFNFWVSVFHYSILVLFLFLKVYVAIQARKQPIPKPESVNFSYSNGKKAVVIGAGPSGLVALKTLLENGYEVILLDKMDRIGGQFAKHNPNTQLTSSTNLTAFSDFPFDSRYSSFISIGQYLNYLNNYADHFSLQKHIRLNCEVQSVQSLGEESWKVKFRDLGIEKEFEIEADILSVSTGLHNSRKLNSQVQNIDLFKGIVDSFIYGETIKNKTLKNILICGTGETAWEAVKKYSNDDEVEKIYVVNQNGFFPFPNELKSDHLYFPKVLKNQSTTDTQVPPMFIYHGAHKRLLESRALFFLIDGIALPLYFMFIQPFGVKKGKRVLPKKGFPSSIQHFIMKTDMGKETGIFWNSNSIKVEYVTLPNVLPDGKIKTKEKLLEIDVIIDGSGFSKPTFSFLNFDPEINTRHIINNARPTISFIGYTRPSVGAIPPLSEAQVIWWLNYLDLKNGNGKIDLSLEYYSMLPPRGKKDKSYGVHFDAYLFQLAKDMGLSPKFKDIFVSPKKVFSFYFSHGGAYQLRIFGNKPNLIAEKTAFYQAVNYGVLSAKGIWGMFLFLLMLIGIFLLFWGTLLIYVLSPILLIPIIKKKLSETWENLIEKYCDAEFSNDLGKW